jgi:hypothetical protein
MDGTPAWIRDEKLPRPCLRPILLMLLAKKNAFHANQKEASVYHFVGGQCEGGLK